MRENDTENLLIILKRCGLTTEQNQKLNLEQINSVCEQLKNMQKQMKKIDKEVKMYN